MCTPVNGHRQTQAACNQKRAFCSVGFLRRQPQPPFPKVLLYTAAGKRLLIANSTQRKTRDDRSEDPNRRPGDPAPNLSSLDSKGSL